MTPEPHDPVAIALTEDIGSGDVTTEQFVPPTLQATGRVIAREPATVAGTQTAAEVFRRIDPEVEITIHRTDGSQLDAGDCAIEIRGAARSILTGERVALNFLQQLSGVATLTRRFVDAVAGSSAKIVDTRKTVPGLRALQKAAVLAGGGVNHRFGLFDMVLIKDNHLIADDNLTDKIARLKNARSGIRVEVEADTLEQVAQFLRTAGVDVILLDNMTPAQLQQAVALRGTLPVKLEASGGVSLATVAEIAATGVDYISVGALTHSARAIDFSLELRDVSR